MLSVCNALRNNLRHRGDRRGEVRGAGMWLVENARSAPDIDSFSGAPRSLKAAAVQRGQGDDREPAPSISSSVRCSLFAFERCRIDETSMASAM